MTAFKQSSKTYADRYGTKSLPLLRQKLLQLYKSLTLALYM